MGGAELVYNQISPGYRFPPVRIQLQKAMVDDYLKAVHGRNTGPGKVTMEDGRETVPPTAAGVLAMRSLMDSVSLPHGSIHISQDFEFKGLMAVGDTVLSQAEVVRKQERGAIRLLTMDIVLANEASVELIRGRMVVMVPPEPSV